MPSVDLRPLNPTDGQPLNIGWEVVDSERKWGSNLQYLRRAGGTLIEGWLRSNLIAQIDPTGFYFLMRDDRAPALRRLSMNQHSSYSRRILWWILSSVIFAACAHIDLPSQAVAPAPVGAAKLPLKVGVLNDPALTIHQPWDFYEKLNPSMANLVRDALAANFEKVELADTRESAEDATLLAVFATDI